MNALALRREVVSSEDDLLIVVDADDRMIRTLPKSACHDGEGVLHRAFSLFVFNPAGETLLQRRQTDKRLWPSYWSNGCCSHPRVGEELRTAAVRRAGEELGLPACPQFAFKFQYHALFGDIGAEREVCSVFLARTDAAPRINATEVADWRWIAPQALDAELDRAPEAFTPWLKLEWPRLRRDFADWMRGA